MSTIAAWKLVGKDVFFILWAVLPMTASHWIDKQHSLPSDSDMTMFFLCVAAQTYWVYRGW